MINTISSKPSERYLQIFFFMTLFAACAATLHAQSKSTYLKDGEIIARFPMHFSSGYMFITVPVIDTDMYGQSVTLSRSFVLDPAASNDGSYQPDDSLVNVTGTRSFYFPVSKQRTLNLDLVPTLAKERYKVVDTSFYGVLGYAFLRKYITIINYLEQTVTLYSISEKDPQWDSRLDTAAIFVPYLDDAVLDHCNCSFPTMWLDVEAPPLKPGRVHFALAERQSTIFRQALEPKTQKFLDDKLRQDSIAGKKDDYSGISVDQFQISGINIAKRNPRRTISDLPPIFRNLNIFIIGTLGVDVLRHFPAVIIDPTRSRLMFVK
ncbi:MAG: hypothetical protein ABI778_12185 [Ignavibacteriota bacterium]